MKRRIHHIFTIFAYLFIFYGCATYGAQKVVPTPIQQAQEEITEEALMDVGIAVFKSGELTEKKAKEEGTNSDIRKAESHFIPYHLKNTLQSLGRCTGYTDRDGCGRPVGEGRDC